MKSVPNPMSNCELMPKAFCRFKFDSDMQIAPLRLNTLTSSVVSVICLHYEYFVEGKLSQSAF